MYNDYEMFTSKHELLFIYSTHCLLGALFSSVLCCSIQAYLTLASILRFLETILFKRSWWSPFGIWKALWVGISDSFQTIYIHFHSIHGIKKQNTNDFMSWCYLGLYLCHYIFTSFGD